MWYGVDRDPSRSKLHCQRESKRLDSALRGDISELAGHRSTPLPGGQIDNAPASSSIESLRKLNAQQHCATHVYSIIGVQGERVQPVKGSVLIIMSGIINQNRCRANLLLSCLHEAFRCLDRAKVNGHILAFDTLGLHLILQVSRFVFFRAPGHLAIIRTPMREEDIGPGLRQSRDGGWPQSQLQAAGKYAEDAWIPPLYRY